MFAAVCGWVDEQSAFRVITQLSACMPLWKWKVLSHTLRWCIIIISATVVINHGKCFPNRRARCRRSSVWSSSSSVLLLSRPPVVFAPHHLSRLHHLSRFIFPLLLYVQGENFIPMQSYVSMIERKSWELDGDDFEHVVLSSTELEHVHPTFCSFLLILIDISASEASRWFRSLLLTCEASSPHVLIFLLPFPTDL